MAMYVWPICFFLPFNHTQKLIGQTSSWTKVQPSSLLEQAQHQGNMDDLLTFFFIKAAPYPNTFIVFTTKEP